MRVRTRAKVEVLRGDELTLRLEETGKHERYLRRLGYNNLDFLTSLERHRDGTNCRELTGSWSNEPQYSFPMVTQGRERVPRHLSGHLWDDSSACVWHSNILTRHQPYSPVPLSAHLSFTCCLYYIVTMPWLNHTSLSSVNSY